MVRMENPSPIGLRGTLKPASRKIVYPPSPYANQDDEQPEEEEEEYDETRQKLQTLRVKLLRLTRRLGLTLDHYLVLQVLYRFWFAEQFNTTKGAFSPALTFDRASAVANRLESPPGQHEPLGLTCTILVIGKSGSGKTSTLNSIFDKPIFATTAFGPGTTKIQVHVGTLHGINLRVIDTPGLSPSDHRHNEKTLRSVKSFLKKTPPDIVLYVDRLDTRGGGDGMALMGTITSVFGPSFLSNVVVVFTHAASPPPEDENIFGTETGYDAYVAQRRNIAQQSIHDASGETQLMNLFLLAENHLGCRKNMDGQPVLPNGQVWKHELLLMCFASKIMAEANFLLKFLEPAPLRSLPHLPSLLSSFLQSRPQVKLNDDDLDSDSGSDLDLEDDEYEYDKLLPFKSLTRDELEKLSRSQRNAYYDETEYREKLFVEKQIKEEKRKRKMMREMREMQEETGQNDETNQPSSWTVLPVHELNGWDHENGVVGAHVGRVFVLKEKIPILVVARGTNNKTKFQMEIASSIKHGKGKSTSLGFDIQPTGYDNDMAYTIRGETLFSNRRTNKVSAGVTATLLGGVLIGGVKLVDKMSMGRWVELEGCGGANCSGSGDVAYSGGLEVMVRDRDDTSGRFLTTFGLDVTEWQGDVGLGGRAGIQVPFGRHDNLVARINVDNRGFGKLGFSVGGSDRVQIAFIFLIPLVKQILFSTVEKLARLVR